MSRQGASWDDVAAGKKHALKVIKKQERIAGLKDLRDTWEAHEAANGYRASDHRTVLKIRAELRAAENQLEAMA